MKKIVKLTESDLEKIVKRVLQEQTFPGTSSTEYMGYKDRSTTIEPESKPEPEYSDTNLTKNAKNWKELYDILVKNKKIRKGVPMMIVWGPTQKMYYTKDGKTLDRELKVSTGAGGFGNTSQGKLTSTGLMEVSDKIKAPKKYQVLISKIPTNIVLGPNIDSTRKDSKGRKHSAEVLTGILGLIGLEPFNKNVASRAIYVHGTNKEKGLGGKHSNGCIRVSNDNILYLLNSVPIGAKLYVKP